MTEDEIRSQMHESIERLGGRVMERDESSIQPKTHTSKADTHLVTYTYIQQGMSLDEIAALRELKTSTILSHLEKLIEE